eukprot:scaffold6389_cov108-Isochrysis_galbana.AAC.2
MCHGTRVACRVSPGHRRSSSHASRPRVHMSHVHVVARAFYHTACASLTLYGHVGLRHARRIAVQRTSGTGYMVRRTHRRTGGPPPTQLWQPRRMCMLMRGPGWSWGRGWGAHMGTRIRRATGDSIDEYMLLIQFYILRPAAGAPGKRDDANQRA